MSVMAAVLGAVEDAAPVDAVEAVTYQLGRALDARSVSFLIADLAGRALVRLAHVPLQDSASGPAREGDEVTTVLPFDGGAQEQALRTQTPRVLAGDGGWTVMAPVTERGDAIGLLELVLPAEPDARTVEEISKSAHLLGWW